MRLLVLMIAMLLSPVFGDRGGFVPADQECTVVQSTSEDRNTDFSLNRDACLPSVHLLSFSGTRSPSPHPLRFHSPGRRTLAQVRTAFRYISPSFVVTSGTNIPERYLLSICLLRI
ncbi:MAG: hypothetical protein ACI4AE_04075 [Candidatus Cryptobacteroides sp.]